MQKTVPGRVARVLATAALAVAAGGAFAQATTEVQIDGGDAIYLAGRTDLVIPPYGVPWPSGLARHPFTPEAILETFPPFIAVAAGDVIRAFDPAIGGISFYNGFGNFFGPEGNVPSGSNLTSFGGISGFNGPQGALVGVFLTDAVPNAAAPAALDFSSSGVGIEFTSLAPGIGQVFFIGNGQTAGGTFQQFVAPTGSTRLFLGIADGFGFNGAPGAYEDNDGFYKVRIGVNQIPTVPAIPEPETYALMLAGLGALGWVGRRRRLTGADASR